MTIYDDPLWKDLSTSAEGDPPPEEAPPDAAPPEASLDLGERSEPRETSTHRDHHHGGHQEADGPPDGSRRAKLQAERDSDAGLSIPECAIGNVIHMMCEDCQWIEPHPLTCKRRTCPSCAHAKFIRMVERYAPLCRDASYPKLLTLTLKRGQDPQVMVNRAIECFQKLRRRELMEDQVGGAYFLEGKPPSETGDGWNVHLHVLLDGPPIPQAIISKVWLELTGDSQIVDIRKVTAESGLAYALGYCLEGSKVEAVWGDAPEDQRKTWDDAVKHRRLVQTFGSWHGATEPEKDYVKTCPICESTTWSVLEYMGEDGAIIAEGCGFTLWWDSGLPSGQQTLEVGVG